MKTKLNAELVAQLLRASELRNTRLFTGVWRSEPKYIAQEYLRQRSHYADDSTLAYFKSRILSVREERAGCLLVIIESLPVGSFDAARGFRFRVFDVDGTVLNRDDEETSGSHKTSEKASQAARTWIDTHFPTVDSAFAHTLQVIADAHHSTVRRLAECKKAFAKIGKRMPARSNGFAPR